MISDAEVEQIVDRRLVGWTLPPTLRDQILKAARAVRNQAQAQEQVKLLELRRAYEVQLAKP